MIPFIDGPFIKENKYDLIYIGTPNVELNAPAFSVFDIQSFKDLPITEGSPMKSEDFSFVLCRSSGVAVVADKEIFLGPSELLIIYPNTTFFLNGSELSAKTMKLVGDLSTSIVSYTGRNCHFKCDSESIYFDNIPNKGACISKFHEIQEIEHIKNTLTFQIYVEESKKIVFPDRKTSRYVFQKLQSLNQEYSKILDELIDKSQYLFSVEPLPMSDTEDLTDIIRWMKSGYQSDYHTESFGNLKLI